jgi:hypothetical protein
VRAAPRGRALTSIVAGAGDTSTAFPGRWNLPATEPPCGVEVVKDAVKCVREGVREAVRDPFVA